MFFPFIHSSGGGAAAGAAKTKGLSYGGVSGLQSQLSSWQKGFFKLGNITQMETDPYQTLGL